MDKQPSEIINKIIEYWLPFNMERLLFYISCNKFEYIKEVKILYQISLIDARYLKILNNLYLWKEIEEYTKGSDSLKIVSSGSETTICDCDNKFKFVYYFLNYRANESISHNSKFEMEYLKQPRGNFSLIKYYIKNLLEILTKIDYDSKQIKNECGKMLNEIRDISLQMENYSECTNTSIFNIGKYKFISREYGHHWSGFDFLDWRIDVQNESTGNVVYNLCNFKGQKHNIVVNEKGDFNQELFDEIFEYLEIEPIENYYTAFVALIGMIMEHKWDFSLVINRCSWQKYKSDTIFSPSFFNKCVWDFDDDFICE